MPSLIKEIILPVSGVMLANLCLILCFHVHAVAYTRENDTDESRNNAYNTTTTSSSSSSLWWQFWSRIAQGGGPDALQPLDKILFGVVILLAFELLDFLTKSSGSTYNIIMAAAAAMALLLVFRPLVSHIAKARPHKVMLASHSHVHNHLFCVSVSLCSHFQFGFIPSASRCGASIWMN